MTEQEFRGFLDDICVAFMRPDYALWRTRIQLPFTIVTATGPVSLANDDEVKTNFDQYMEAVEILRITDVVREPLKLEHCSDGTVLATYRTHLLSSGTRVHEPYTSTALLHAHPGQWRMSAILNALGHHHWTGNAPFLTGEKDD
ncbi:hypothetical protein [Primorskyibacter sp. S187A]|uniref:hypothetical protein n=1 Tax=Primorskyibacter sp. S187A TaxID=3415130 RepID=UPI003C7E3B10